MGVTLLSVLTGLFAEEAERGKAFGILSLTSALGTLIGGATAGPIADRWGYPTMFLGLSLCWSLSPLTALALEDKVVARIRDRDKLEAAVDKVAQALRAFPKPLRYKLKAVDSEKSVWEVEASREVLVQYYLDTLTWLNRWAGGIPK